MALEAQVLIIIGELIKSNAKENQAVKAATGYQIRINQPAVSGYTFALRKADCVIAIKYWQKAIDAVQKTRKLINQLEGYDGGQVQQLQIDGMTMYEWPVIKGQRAIMHGDETERLNRYVETQNADKNRLYNLNHVKIHFDLPEENTGTIDQWGSINPNLYHTPAVDHGVNNSVGPGGTYEPLNPVLVPGLHATPNDTIDPVTGVVAVPDEPLTSGWPLAVGAALAGSLLLWLVSKGRA